MDGMKMTLHIDSELLARAMASTGATTKSMAVDLALREMDRKATLVKLASEGLGLAPDEWKDVIDPAYELAALRHRETPMT